MTAGSTDAATPSALSDARRALSDLAARQRARWADRDDIVPLAAGDGWLPATEQQRCAWELHDARPDAPTCNVPHALRLHGPLDEALLRAALGALVTRHETLRTSFGCERGVPFQVRTEAPGDLPLTTVDLSDVAQHERWQRALALATEEAMRPFDLTVPPLMRCWLGRLGPDEHLLVLTVHQIISDDSSSTILVGDLAALYEGMRSDSQPDLPDLPLGTADYAAWEQGWLMSAAADREMQHWRETLDGAESVDLPADRPRPNRPTMSGDTVQSAVPLHAVMEAKQLAAELDASLFDVLVAAFCIVMGRYTQQDEVVIGSAFPGRGRFELQGVVGPFANQLPLRVSLAGSPTVRELVGRCSDAVTEALIHQDAPFGAMLRALRVQPMVGRHPLFQVRLDLETDAIADAACFRDLAVVNIPLSTGAVALDLAVRLTLNAKGSACLELDYSTELFDKERISRFAGHLTIALRELAAGPDQPISSIDMLCPAERATVTTAWNPSPVDFGTEQLLLHDLFAQRAAAMPDHPAVRFEGAEVTYGELDVAANRLARLLQTEHGVGRDIAVGFLLERGPDVALTELAVLKAGGAWLPLDPAYPTNRFAYQLSDADVRAVVTTRALADKLPEGTTAVLLDELREKGALAQLPESAPECAALPDNVAYIIYTSGSTGKPKGVQVPHRAAVNFVGGAGRCLFDVTPDDRILQFANPTFDVSVFDLYAALCSGATCVAAPVPVLHDPASLAELMRREGVTIADIPPAVLGVLDDAELPDLRALFVGLEAFSAELVNRWRTPTRAFHNGYGPTEATVACVDYECPPEPLTAPPPIGRAMPNMRAYVVDRQCDPVPIGVPGELCVAGLQLARGYLGKPGLSADKFVPCPFGEPGERMYRTGDMARWGEDGQLEFLGRVDRQVKIRGLRVELGEIEHALEALPSVRQAAVVVADTDAGPRLDAYLVADEATAPGEADLRAHLADRLPPHMVPATFTVLQSLPLTSSGKVDQRSLPEPTVTSDTAAAPPETSTERALAEIWAELLQVPIDQIGRQSNFFTVGGSSLDLARLGSRVSARLDVKLEPSALYLAPTLSAAAKVVDERRGGAPVPSDDDDEQRSPLVHLSHGESEELVCLVSPVGGSASAYVPLAQLLGSQGTLLALESIGLDGVESFERIEDFAARHLEALRSEQPEGPYRLVGWSAGGTIAFEMASMLREAGEDVAALVLLDTTVEHKPEENDQASLLARFARDVALVQSASAPQLDAATLRGQPPEQQVETVVAALEAEGLVPDGMREEMARRFAVFAATDRAVARYSPRQLDVPVTVIQAAESQDDKGERWREHAPAGMERHVVPGDHYSMLQPPQLDDLAEVLRECLDRSTSHKSVARTGKK
ncbi:MAG: non-ribosomal peptide synthetase [Frankiaceae bacterium]